MRAAVVKGGELRRKSKQIPPRGSDHSFVYAGQFGCKTREVRSTLAGVGSFCVREDGNRALDQARRSGERSPTVKSSTMKGPQGLAGEFQPETVLNRERSRSKGRRVLLVSARRNHERFARGNDATAGAVRVRPGLEG